MNGNAEAITILCSHLCVTDGIRPLEPREWGRLAEILMEKKIQPEFLLDYERKDFTSELGLSDDEAVRMTRLIGRSGSMRFEIARYEDMGIRIVTRADPDYPKQLKKKLGNTCPPLFYYTGELDLLTKPAVGYVGSRTVEPSDIEFTRRTVSTTCSKGYAVVSGGARGIDSISATAAMSESSYVVEFLSDSMLRKMRDAGLMSEIRDGRVLLLSVTVPTAGFNVGVAMMRNRYIYAQSEGTVVIRSEKGNGGTWAGAVENLKSRWCPTFCRDCDYPGNKELIRMGAIGITDDWDGNVDVPRSGPEAPETPVKPVIARQMSLFD